MADTTRKDSDRGPRSGLDALLVMCPTWDTELPPINIAYLAAHCRAQGHEVATLDLNIRLANLLRYRELRDLWNFMTQNLLDADQLADRLFEEVPDIIDGFVRRIVDSGAACVGFSIHARNTAFTERIVDLMRAAGSEQLVIYGGPEVLARLSVDDLAGLRADGYVVGEGEETLAALLERRRRGGALEPLEGLIVARDGQLSELTPRAPIRKLDEIPFPAWEDFDLGSYGAEALDRTVPFLFSRGCMGQCAFCMDHVLAGRYRCRSPDNALEEIRRVVRRLDVRQFHFNDLVCNGSVRKLEQLCDRLLASKLDIMWWSYAVVRRGLTAALFDKLRAAGCSSLVFGLESGSDRVLAAMGKYYTAADAEEALRSCAASGINTGINIIVGFPGETEVEHRETLEFIERNRDHIHRVVNLGTCIIAPGSRLQTEPEAFGIEHEPGATSWTGPAGNTLEVRNRRLEQVHDLLDRLGIPRVIINRELTGGAVSTERVQPAGQRESRMRIIAVDLLDARERPCQRFTSGELLVMVIRFHVDQPQVEPLFRVQIFNDQNPARENQFIFGTNTSRMRVRTGRMEIGAGEARLTLCRLNLGPGKYTCTVGIFPDEEARTALDVDHGAHLFRVMGEVDPSGAKLHTELQWSFAAEGEAGGEANVIDHVTVCEPGGRERPHFGPRDRVALRAACRLAAPERVLLRASILRDGARVQHAVHDGPLPAGRVQAELLLSPLCLLEGDHVVQISLLERQTGEEIATVEEELQVRADPREGAGLIHLPCLWEIQAPRR